MIKHKKIVFVFLVLTAILLFYSVTHTDERDFENYRFVSPNSEDVLIVKEWSDFKRSGDVFFFQRGGNEIYLGAVATNEYLPFKLNQYNLLWGEKEITVQYKYGLLQNWKEIVLKLPDEDRKPE